MKKLLFGLLLATLVSACSNESNTKVSFALTDAPSLKGYQAVYVDVQRIEYRVDSGDFASLPMSPVRVNLLDLTNGQDTLLGNVELEAGQKVSQVRLILGEDNTLVLSDGTEVAIRVPSGQTSGLKFNIQTSVEVTSGYKVMIDFDAEKSIVAKGNGTFSLKPVIRGYIVANTSAIFGHITPAQVPFKVLAIRGTDSILTVSDTLQSNYFRLHGLTSGTYNIQFLNSNDSIVTSRSQAIVGGTNVDLGIVQINP